MPADGTTDGWLFARKVFPKTMLRSSIADKVWLNLARGDLADAVFVAVRTVEGTVRDRGRIASTDVGTILMSPSGI